MSAKKNILEWFREGKELDQFRKITKGCQEIEEEAEKRGYSIRTAYYLMDLALVFTRLVKKDPPPDIDWRKLTVVAPYLGKGRDEFLFDLCRKHSRRQVEQLRKEKKW